MTTTSNKYFIIRAKHSGKVLDASATNEDEVIQYTFHGGDNQLWFWGFDHGDCLQNKKYPNKVHIF